jgi:hypothetical protein
MCFTDLTFPLAFPQEQIRNQVGVSQRVSSAKSSFDDKTVHDHKSWQKIA